jgi:hypothetical protein
MLALSSTVDNAQESDGVRALRRCNEEIARIGLVHDQKAWYAVLGIEDWEVEKRLIEAEQ